jgi:hypothetical protein
MGVIAMLKNKDLVEIDVKEEKENKGLKVAWTVIMVQCIVGVIIALFI